MKKTIAVAALFAATFATAPVAPVQAASSFPSHCLVLPLLQADCREAIQESLKGAGIAASTATKAEWHLPVIGGCERAPAGSGHLYDC